MGNERVIQTKLTTDTVAYDINNDMMKVSSMQKKFRDSFGGSALDATKWDSVVGAGGSLSVSAGQLTMGSGTTINSETSITSKEMFTVPFKFGIGLVLSQRIANQTFYVELISVDKVTGVPDGKHQATYVFDGTVATNAKYRVQNSAVTPLDSALVTIPTTAGAGMYEIEPFGDETWFHGGTLDSTNATSIKPTAGNLYSITISNISASARYVKLYNKATAPTVGTDIPILTISIPAGGIINVPFGEVGYRFGTGIALATTANGLDSDATAIVAGEVKIIASYI